ncbi:Histone-lysine N-methyltransferase SETMAR [Eumeta japonica]|uniref:Histone-lysine N-methyltransferase SETMAR n=1 Tax=Eumeta variegata TaxID=151549 RepID=A0A4C1YZ08_EUMVA|nr:Histone-lysine N-methyltransferase SETMAR [Eumeta japonica]
MIYDKNVRERSWSQGKQAPQTIAKPGFTRNELMLCVWWDWKGIIHYKLLPPGKTINWDLYKGGKTSARIDRNKRYATGTWKKMAGGIRNGNESFVHLPETLLGFRDGLSVTPSESASIFEGAKQKPESRWSSPPIETSNPRGVNSALSASRVRIRYLMQGGFMEME